MSYLRRLGDNIHPVPHDVVCGTVKYVKIIDFRGFILGTTFHCDYQNITSSSNSNSHMNIL